MFEVGGDDESVPLLFHAWPRADEHLVEWYPHADTEQNGNPRLRNPHGLLFPLITRSWFLSYDHHTQKDKETHLKAMASGTDSQKL